MARRQRKAYRAGYARGKAAGSWVIDGNTSNEQKAAIIHGYEDGDPAVMEMYHEPMYRESISDLSEEYGIDLFDEGNADCFEEGFVEGFWAEVILAAKYGVEVTRED